MLSDIRYALRSLAKSPGFTAVSILIVAIGIGAATAMFSTVNALVLRPIALPQPDRLVALYETNLPRNVPLFSVSIPNYLDWQARAKSWESMAALSWRSMNLTGNGEPELVQCKQVTASFLPTLGIPLMLGRNFLAEEDRPAGPKVAILSEAFWRNRLGSAADIVGRTLSFDGESYTVVGVTAPGQPLPSDLEVAIPLAADLTKESRTNHEMQVYGRLKPGVSIEQADLELKTVAAQIWNEHPEMDRGWSTRLLPLAREIVGDGIRKGLFVLLGSVGMLLLIACANLSNLLLVRASARAHELAIRTALGASRAQVIRQIVTESLVVTIAGGLLGIVLSLWTVDLMRSLPLPRAGEISVDFRVMSAALVATLLAGLFAGLGPALKASLARPQEALKGRAPRSGHRSRLRDTMVVTQLAISLTLLVGAALLGRSFLRLLRVNPGFNSDNVLTISLRPNGNAEQFYERLTERIATLPGVSHAGLTSILPLMEGNTSLNVFPQGESILPNGESVQANWRLVDGGYFSAMQIPVISGHTFASLTPDEARRSVVISASLARQLWGDVDPVGRQLDPGGNRRMLTVIGVAGDVRSQTLGTAPSPTFYWSMYRFIYGPMNLVVRSSTETAMLLPAIRAAIKEIDPNVPVFRVRTLEQLRSTSLEQERLILMLLGGFTGVALLLAALGTYGVIAFTVQQRTPEIGIRIAIGAQAGDILRLVLGQGLRLVVFGVAIGLAGAAVAARLLSAMLYETGASDLVSYLIATAALSLAALVAAYLPARRATKVDPVVALRAE
jgi:putative ABC transport system permease protein